MRRFYKHTMDWQQLLSDQRTRKEKSAAPVSRTTFEQDYDRIIFSHPFRRLQDKTQVHPLPEHDFVHTRLTHSLEVSSVGRSLGRTAGEVVVSRHANLSGAYSAFDFGAITAAACLAHDLGNPPFGHAGEDALGDYFLRTEEGQRFRERVSAEEWYDLTHFEGNAQGFRIITAKEHGLQLSAATLGAFTKYPCSSTLQNREKGRKSQKKFGFFQSEKTAFHDLAVRLGLKPLGEDAWCRHPLAFLVEAADDICYSIIDLEDGCNLGLVSQEDTIELLAGIIGSAFRRDKLAGKSQKQQTGILRAMAINTLVKQASDVFVENEREILAGSFDRALTDLCPASEVLAAISKLSVQKIYQARHVVEIEASGHEILPGLLHEFVEAADLCFLQKNTGKTQRKYKNLALLLPEEIKRDLEAGPGTYTMLRLCLDFISGLTDRHALSLFRKIKGISL